jgi:Fur family ferric uptake transcriptional regulator
MTLPHCPVHDLHLPDQDLNGFQPLYHTLEFFGLCGRCRNRDGHGVA